MKMIIRAFISINILMLANSVWALSTSIVNNTVEELPIIITYKVCTAAQYPVVCEPVKQTVLQPKKAFPVELTSGQSVYLLTAQIKNGEMQVAGSNYTSQSLAGSYCYSDFQGFITLNTFYTNHVGCLVIKG